MALAQYEAGHAAGGPTNLAGKYVILTVGPEIYGVSVSDVQSIIPMSPITRVPGTSGYVEGVINLRGNVIPVLDLGRRMGQPAEASGERGRILVVEHERGQVGLIVDQVTEVRSLEAGQIEPPSSLVRTQENEFVLGVARDGDRLILLLDVKKILLV